MFFVLWCRVRAVSLGFFYRLDDAYRRVLSCLEYNFVSDFQKELCGVDLFFVLLYERVSMALNIIRGMTDSIVIIISWSEAQTK